MSLTTQVETALQALSSPSAARQLVDAAAAGQRFSCELTALDSLACACCQFLVESDRLAPLGIHDLKRVAEQLSARLTYLLEPIQPIEVDPDQCVVQMRSVPPQKDEHRVSYYELLVGRGGRLSLCRYAKDASSLRQEVPAHVTREVFLRLVGDFSAVA